MNISSVDKFWCLDGRDGVEDTTTGLNNLFKVIDKQKQQDLFKEGILISCNIISVIFGTITIAVFYNS